MSAPPGIVAGRRRSTAQGWDVGAKDADIALSGADRIATLVSSGSQVGAVRSVTGHTNDGDYYAEVTIGGADGIVLAGLVTSAASLAIYPGADATGWAYYGNDGTKYNNNVSTGYGSSYAVGDVIGIRLNAGTLTFYKNGASQGAAFAGLSGTYFIAWGPGTGSAGTRVATLNTGQSAFAFPPSGVTAWG